MTTPQLRVRGRYPIKPGGKAVAPSVTTISGMLDKPGLSWGAAKETALFAIHHQDEWISLDEKAAYDRLRNHHRGVWNGKAERGTLVHALAVEWAEGNAVECPEDCLGYLDALERFYIEQTPEWLQVERTVIYDEPAHHAYGGSFDWIARLADGRVWMGDFKTGQRYPGDVILQMAGYRYAKKMVVCDELGAFVGTEPMQPVDCCGVLYLHEDGTYELLELPVNGEAFGTFLRLRDVWNWKQEADKWVKAHPEIKPAREDDVA